MLSGIMIVIEYDELFPCWHNNYPGMSSSTCLRPLILGLMISSTISMYIIMIVYFDINTLRKLGVFSQNWRNCVFLINSIDFYCCFVKSKNIAPELSHFKKRRKTYNYIDRTKFNRKISVLIDYLLLFGIIVSILRIPIFSKLLTIMYFFRLGFLKLSTIKKKVRLGNPKALLLRIDTKIITVEL